MKRTFLGLLPFCLAASFTVACGDDGGGGTASSETGDGDGDGDTGDGDGDTGDGDGDSGDGDGDSADTEPPPPDTDMDGVADPDDNCPADPNPNQLDFDSNGMGNVCDTQMFMTIGGSLNTTANADAGFAGSCNIPITFDVTGGQIMVQLDDNAEIAAFEIVELSVADILDEECALLVTANISLKDFTITNSGGAFPVMMAHSQAQHDGGQIAGMSDIPHPVLSTASLEASVNGGDPMASELNLDGALPVFTANVMGAGASGTLAWADPQFVLATDMFEIMDPVAITINFELTGLVGNLSIAP